MNPINAIINLYLPTFSLINNGAKIVMKRGIVLNKVVIKLKSKYLRAAKRNPNEKRPEMILKHNPIFDSILKVFCKEVGRYKNCQLNVLGSHLSPDSRSGSSGDVEIIKQGSLFESYEIKLDVVISNHIINRVKDKIFKHNPKRYFIISSKVDTSDKDKIKENISKVHTEHGCQIFIEDPLKLVERYIRVISEVNDFLKILSDMIINDEELKEYLHEFDWANSMVLAHNTMFDGAILSWLFDIRPRVWADTLCIARSLHGVEASGSLKALAERYSIGEKGTEVLDALGKRREDFTDDELDSYGDYCINDVELTYKLFNIFLNAKFCLTIFPISCTFNYG